MFKNKVIIACLMSCFAAVASIAQTSTQAPAATIPAAAATTTQSTVVSVVSISNCTAENGKLGDANAPIRDFCLTQTTDISTGQAHVALPFAMAYYTATGCSAANSILDGNCKSAANIIANGTALAFHLNYNTLHKIRNAVPPGSTSNCPCSAVS